MLIYEPVSYFDRAVATRQHRADGLMGAQSRFRAFRRRECFSGQDTGRSACVVFKDRSEADIVGGARCDETIHDARRLRVDQSDRKSPASSQNGPIHHTAETGADTVSARTRVNR